VDFSSKLISKSAELYQSSAVVGNVHTETATSHLVQLNDKLKIAATTTRDSALEKLYISCSTVTDELLTALDKVKVDGERSKWKSIRKALRTV
jgi:hypothetical protein